MADITVRIYSHSRSHKIASADFTYDLRKIDNPPREMRRQFDGRAKRLREHLLRDTTFSAMLESAAVEIDAACKNTGTSTFRSIVGCSINLPGLGVLHDGPVSKQPVDDHGSQILGEEGSDAQSETATEESEVRHRDGAAIDDSKVLTISCFCERGKHRSVAFAEELAKRLGYWHVALVHTDIDRKPAKIPRDKDRKLRLEIDEDR